MRQKPLSYWVFLVSGGLITVMSLVVTKNDRVENTSGIQLFLYVGIGFIIIGLLKILVKRLGRSELTFAKRMAGVDPAQKLENSIKKDTRQPVITYCRQCGTKNYSTSFYCHMCGLRLK